MTTRYLWRGDFANTEVNGLHAEAFETRIFSDEEWDWQALVQEHSLGWVLARDNGLLVGFVNVIWDGLVHAWLQDTMVSGSRRTQRIGTRLVDAAREGAKDAGCEFLHVDFEPHLAKFYIDACGFDPAPAGIMRL